VNGYSNERARVLEPFPTWTGWHGLAAIGDRPGRDGT